MLFSEKPRKRWRNNFMGVRDEGVAVFRRNSHWVSPSHSGPVHMPKKTKCSVINENNSWPVVVSCCLLIGHHMPARDQISCSVRAGQWLQNEPWSAQRETGYFQCIGYCAAYIVVCDLFTTGNVIFSKTYTLSFGYWLITLLTVTIYCCLFIPWECFHL